MEHFKPSKAAQKQGVCHTEEECYELYASISDCLKQPAIERLRKWIPKDERARMQALIQTFGDRDWFDHINDEEIAKLSDDMKARGFGAMFSPHFGLGMNIRNFLREKGYGEKYFGVHNLDCIYTQLFTEAAK